MIDVGSNSLLLVVSEWNGEAWQELVETSEVTGFGRNVHETGSLCEEAIADCLNALSRAFAAARNLNVEPIAFATMAARIANNVNDFLRAASDAGTPVRILSADDEARFGMLAVCEDPIFASDTPLTIVDVGGHSTEIVSTILHEHRRHVVFQNSFAVGTLGVSALSPEMESPNGLDLLRGSVEIDDIFSNESFAKEPGKVVALGATATNLVSIKCAIVPWDASAVHSARLTFEEISKFAGDLSKMSLAERSKLPGLEPGRERTIHIGALILERALHALGAAECFVSAKGWRHAILACQ